MSTQVACESTTYFTWCAFYALLSLPNRKALSNSFVYGFTYGFSQGALFIGYIIAFRFGAYLVTRPLDNIVYTPFNDVFVVLFALVFGAMAAGQASAFAPNYAKARLSANRIFALLDRVPATTVYCSDEGSTLVSPLGFVSLASVYIPLLPINVG